MKDPWRPVCSQMFHVLLVQLNCEGSLICRCCWVGVFFLNFSSFPPVKISFVQTQTHHSQRGRCSFSRDTKDACFSRCQIFYVRLKAAAKFLRAAHHCCCMGYPFNSARVIRLENGLLQQFPLEDLMSCRKIANIQGHPCAVLEAICSGCLCATVCCPFIALCALRNLLSWASSLNYLELSAKVVSVLDSRPWLLVHLANFLNSS